MQWLIYILLLIILIGLLLELRIRKTYRQFIDKRTGTPIPVSGGLFSSALTILRTRWDVDWGQHVKQTGLKYGPIYSSYLLGPSVVLADPEGIKTILSKIEDFPMSPFWTQNFPHAKGLLNPHNLNFVNNPEWKEQRKLLNPIFASPSIFLEPILQKVNLCVSKWENQISGVAVGEDMKKLTLDVLATCIFGIDFDTLSGELPEPIEAYYHSAKTALLPIRSLLPWVNKLPLKWNKDMYRALSVFDKYCWEIMHQTQKKNEREEGKLRST